MTWHQTDNLKEFATAIEPLLSAQPERYTVMATVLGGLLEHGPHLYGADPPLLLWWTSAGQIQAAALQTPPHPLQITTLPGGSAGELAELLVTDDHARGIRQVNGGERDATAFVAAWCDRTGQRYRTDKRMRLYRLTTLTPPDPMPDGAPRVGAPADRDIERAWNEAFHRETQPGSPGQELQIRADSGRLVLWELAGTPVSMAGFTSAIAGVARIAPVYTPPEHRNHGYGGAATAAATRLTIEAGATSVVLFTDLANPVSNALYIKLGYQAVEDKVILAIERS